MKKLFYFLMALPLALSFTSCDDDDDKLPDVSLSINLEGVQKADKIYYAVQGDTIVLQSIELINNTDKRGTLGTYAVYWDGIPMYRTNIYTDPLCLIDTNVSPYGLLGNHRLTIAADIAVVDYPLCVGAADFYIKVVENEDEIPDTSVKPEPDPTMVKIGR